MDETQLNILFSNGILVDSSIKDINISDIEGLIKSLKENNVDFLDINTFHKLYEGEASTDSSIEIIKNYEGEISEAKPANWVNYFNDRFNRLKTILMSKDRSGLLSIANIKNMPQSSDVKSIVMVSSVSISPVKKYTILDIEDNTGSYKAIITNSNQEILEDQVVIISGRKYNDAIFVKDIVFPDIQMKEKVKQEMDDAFILFLSDIHVGSKLFVEDAFEKFIKWINGEIQEYSDIAKLVKFIVLNGDLIDGIGVYPDQEKELAITDLKGQYDKLYSFLDRIPKNIKIILSQGNHDATHIAEPQPKLDKVFAENLYKLKNAVFLSNPYQVNLIVGKSTINLLSYHGFSITYYANKIPKYTKMDAEDIENIMKIQLKSRHLAPSHGSTQLMPLPKDYLVIEETPDIYATGHIHKTLASIYKGTVLINSSCWQYQTSYQKKYGMVPDVAKIPVVNMRDKSFQILDFLGDKVQIYKKGLKGE
ncbi:MAG: DNA-directed DNA polymerase [Candidatus Parvarchaeum acidiphilum ARMAN-4]|jgi:DNA polymerase II small subunit|uniref:DNA polymerase II small subunit n=1 Tax=Candidatus Parvarchaeum acidiphilum ARMAN-4 TaxID=662760 RepID=D2EGP1_PARA4|nr:MAG: DNA-directed DNA polymerase [Candidatus Parvarchaeum acidiphilum ARMAN-4]